jgi:hypothetical protein
MYQNSIFEMLKNVISSWQVIVVTVALVLYIYIVNYVARSYHRPRMIKKISFKRKPKPAADAVITDESNDSSNSNEDLGLEEAT